MSAIKIESMIQCYCWHCGKELSLTALPTENGVYRVGVMPCENPECKYSINYREKP